MIAIAKPSPRYKTARRTVKRIPLASVAQRRLRECGYLSLMCVECNCNAGVALLTGQVPSYHMKQVAQEVVRKTTGVVQVCNFLEVLERSELG